MRGETIMPMRTEKMLRDMKKSTKELLKETNSNGISKDVKKIAN